MVIVSPSVNELIFNLSIISAIQNQNIEYVNQEMYYVNQLRRNIHISDTSQDYELNVDIYEDELNLGDYDVDDLDD